MTAVDPGYTVVVRGEVPPDLVERIEAAYAAALAARAQVAEDPTEVGS